MDDSAGNILVVDDDGELGRMLCGFLERNGFQARLVGDGQAADRALQCTPADLIVLDLMLPGEGGLSICRRLRAGSSVPIIMLTALGEEVDRVVGLEVGADDYLAKPFGTRELLARIRAVLRRSRLAAEAERPATQLTFAGWQLARAARRLLNPAGARVTLTSAEFDLLVAFCEQPNRVLSRDRLLDLTHGQAATPFDRSIDILVSRLRRKIEADPSQPELIVTVRAEGYLFTPHVQHA